MLEAFAEFGDDKGDGCGKPRNRKPKEDETHYRIGGGRFNDTATYSDTGTAARFFYTAKASRSERGEGNNHPTVKPISLMRWLVRLVADQGDVVLDPFLGSGTTMVACMLERVNCIGIEKNADYIKIAEGRVGKTAEKIKRWDSRPSFGFTNTPPKR